MRYPIEGTSKDNGTILYCNFVKVETTTLPSKEVKIEVGNRGLENMFFGDFWDDVEGKVSIKEPDQYADNIVTIVLIILGILTLNIGLVLAALILRFTALQDIIKVIWESIQIKTGEAKRFGRYHAATHMLINAYKQLGTVPTLEELKKFSRFSMNCTSVRVFSRIVAVLPACVFI